MRWSIVLAGGNGSRLRSYIERRFGEPRPKQYCALVGDRSLLQQTLDRAARLTGALRTVTVVAAEHDRWSGPQLADHPGKVIRQPLNRETAPGVYLPLTYVRARDPDAIVYLLPSDHVVQPLDRFVAAVRAAGDLAARYPDRIVLTGVEPSEPDATYGYIDPGPPVSLDRSVRFVRGFVEKPDLAGARAAVARGALWNTMIVAARVEALWEAARATLPRMIGRLEAFAPHVDGPFEGPALETIYVGMPVANFSRDVLQHACARCLVIPLAGVEWSDWGVPERISAA